MSREPKPLTPRDYEVLNELYGFHESNTKRGETRGARPLDVGGGSRSHHSATLQKLCARALAWSKNWAFNAAGERVHGERGSRLYWITDQGIKEAEAYRVRQREEWAKRKVD